MKPFIIPNCDPQSRRRGGMRRNGSHLLRSHHRRDHESGAAPAGVIGETFDLFSNCGPGPGSCTARAPDAGPGSGGPTAALLSGADLDSWQCMSFVMWRWHRLRAQHRVLQSNTDLLRNHCDCPGISGAGHHRVPGRCRRAGAEWRRVPDSPEARVMAWMTSICRSVIRCRLRSAITIRWPDRFCRRMI